MIHVDEFYESRTSHAMIEPLVGISGLTIKPIRLAFTDTALGGRTPQGR